MRNIIVQLLCTFILYQLIEIPINKVKSIKMIIAHIRKSTGKQIYKHQEYEIKEYAKKHNLKNNKWVEESISSRKELRKRQLLDELQEGSIPITTEISRLGRSLLEVMGILQICLTKNCQVITIKENYHLGNDIQSKVLALESVYLALNR